MDALADAPVHARRLLFGTLVDSLGDDSLAILSALLLRRAVAVEEKDGRGGKKNKRASEQEEDASYNLVEFAHQTVHCSGGKAQVGILGLLEFCVCCCLFSRDNMNNYKKDAPAGYIGLPVGKASLL